MAINPTLRNLDFSRLKYPIHTVPAGTDLLSAFPELQYYPEFKEYKGGDVNEVIRYIILMYDKGTPLMKAFQDLRQRKEAALDLAGFKRSPNGKFKNEIYRMVNLEKDLVKEDPEDEDSKYVTESNKIFEMVMRYVIEQKCRTWSMIISNEQTFDEYQRLIMEAVSDRKDKDLLTAAKIKDDLNDYSEKTNIRIEKYLKELFGDNEDIKEEFKRKPIRPETL